jgi:tripartite-type tricarboxylate transporter receptor subunit TctC
MRQKVLVLFLLALFVGSGSSGYALEKEYPTKPVEILCPYAPGGGSDSAARLVTDVAPKYLGQKLVVVTKSGAGGSVAAADVISSRPDGYKLAWLGSIYFAIITKTQKIPFDPTHLVPIANIMESRAGMWVKSDAPWKTLPELLDYAKKKPAGLKWAHSGRGSTVHLNGIMLFKAAGVETIEVPYKGGAAECITALLGGHVDAMSMVWSPLVDHLKAGNVRLLTFYSDQRYSDMPNVPCTSEFGFTELGKLATLFGIYAHKDTPEKIRETLTNVFKKTSEDPDFKKALAKLEEGHRFGGPAFLKEAIKKAEEAGVPILKDLGLYVGK